jgi:hypothetical protein
MDELLRSLDSIKGFLDIFVKILIPIIIVGFSLLSTYGLLRLIRGGIKLVFEIKESPTAIIMFIFIAVTLLIAYLTTI